MATLVPVEEPNLFPVQFEALTGHPPFPWQENLYSHWFSQGKNPAICNLPTGLGKTSVVAIWLISLATYPNKMPRRLVYVVNRRTVVDQTTSEVVKLRSNLRAAGLLEPLRRLYIPLADNEPPLAISTLRGQFADNREWSADPSRPAVIVGTVDMIGSRLLFSGYGVGFKAKPLHAGFLAQDVLLVHDEAHLEPAFQALLNSIEKEQDRCREFQKFRVMALTATSRMYSDSFGLTDQERNPPVVVPDPPTEPVHIVWRRLNAAKRIRFETAKREQIAKQIGLAARQRKASGKTILVFVHRLEDVDTVKQVLTDKREGVSSTQVQVLTGTVRGLERDRLVQEDPIFARFLLKTEPDQKTVYLIATSAGEVGIDLSADHLVCDLTPLDSMIQRLGRVNRRGDGVAEIDLVYEKDPDEKEKDDELEKPRWKTLKILQKLPRCDRAEGRHDASPLGLLTLELSEGDRRAAFTPEPTILATSDILFDSWTLTTIRGKLPGRPPVERYLHGMSRELPETSVAWREEVGLITDPLLDEYEPKDLLEDYPLKPHELLRDRSDRVFKHFAEIAERNESNRDSPVWLVHDDGEVEICTLGELTDKNNRERINYRTVLLPPSVGGLDKKGFLDGDPGAETSDLLDVADEWFDDHGSRRRIRVWDNETPPEGMRLIRTIDTNPLAEEQETETRARRYWRWYELPKTGDSDGSKTAKKAVAWPIHTNDVVRNVERIVEKLHLRVELKNAIIVAAKCHDLGKKRAKFQKILGNTNGKVLLEKSGTKRGFGLREDYRHEFGSLLDAENEPAFKTLSDEMKDLVLHLIAAHHGRGRPHFPPDEAFDPEPKGKDASVIASEVPRRFARLQRKYGRWGLAYLESLLRAADYAASANPSAFIEGDQ
jgi:CRISPR-associated endonuclease/helicase Cas3